MTTETIQIVDCGGKYEVHPAADGATWCVVNSETGAVRNEAVTRLAAIALAKERNAGD